MRLKDKTAVVTGGGSGIGASIARALAAAGCRVVISGRRADKLQEVAANHQNGSPALRTHVADVADRASAEELIAWATTELGRIDILVNCAGINIANRSMQSLDPADWDRLLQVNASGAYYCIRAVLPQMRERRDGLIINISSVAGIRASMLGGVAYSASKFAMTSLGLCVGVEEKHNGIRVTNVYPGEVSTAILDDRIVPASAEHRARILQPEDVAEMVAAIACLTPRAHIPEIVIVPATQEFV